MPLLTRRWNDPRGPGDGFRLLICRFRPRGVSAADETWDEWWPRLGPSRELHAAFYGKAGDAIGWEEYRARYLAEMKSQWIGIEVLAKRHTAGKTITLLCSSACDDPARCHRSLLADLIETSAAGPHR
ncbi:MAG: DUF488 family protein [Planctomycetota bacterium]